MPFRLLLLDDHRLFAECLTVTLASRLSAEVVHAASPDAAVTALRQSPVDMVVSEVFLGAKSVMDWLPGYLNIAPGPQLLLLAAAYCENLIQASLKLQAIGYLLKSDSLDDLLGGITTGMQGRRAYSSSIRAHLDSDDGVPRLNADSRARLLSEVQLRIMRHLVAGHSVKDTARLLGATPKSIDSHKYRIMKLMQAHSLTQLARMAVAKGLVAASYLDSTFRRSTTRDDHQPDECRSPC